MVMRVYDVKTKRTEFSQKNPVSNGQGNGRSHSVFNEILGCCLVIRGHPRFKRTFEFKFDPEGAGQEQGAGKSRFHKKSKRKSRNQGVWIKAVSQEDS